MQYLPYIVSLVLAILTGLISYFLAIKKSKDDNKLLVEKYNLEKTNYISKARFDTEFAIYRDLSEKTFNMVIDNSRLFPDKLVDSNEPTDKDELQKLRNKYYQDAITSHSNAFRTLNRNAPFISKELYEEFSKLYRKCRIQTFHYRNFVLGALTQGVIAELSDEYRKCYDNTTEINNDLDSLINKLRYYIQDLTSKEIV